MPLPESDVDVPGRANHALTKKTLTKEWGIKPWNYDRLTAGDLQDVALAEHAEAYIKHEQHEQARGGGMRSTRNSDDYKEWQDDMEQQFGGVQ